MITEAQMRREVVMRAVRWLVTGAGGAILILGSASMAGAEITGTNGCEASGTWREAGITVDAATAEGVITIPRSDTVDWTASVTAPPGEYEGKVWIKLPPPLNERTIDSWSGNSQTTSNSGTEEYDLPALVPAGVEIIVGGEHTDQNGTCSGSVTVEFDGGPFSSPVTAISLAGTAATGAGLAAMLRPMFRRVA
jgi:hypothetical protein